MFRDYPWLRDMHNPSYRDTPETVRVIESQLDRPLSWTKPVMVFVCSMSDYFHPAVPDEVRYRTFLNMTHEAAGARRGLLGTPQGRAQDLAPQHLAGDLGRKPEIRAPDNRTRTGAGTREVRLRRTLIGPVDLRPWLEAEQVEWIIVGGESGPDARDMNIEWAEDLRFQAHQHGAAFFLKQLGGKTDKRGGAKAVLDGTIYHQMPNSGQQ